MVISRGVAANAPYDIYSRLLKERVSSSSAVNEISAN